MNNMVSIPLPEQMHPYQSLSIDERVKRVLLNTPLFDGHNDLPQQPRCVTHGKIYDQPRFDLEKGFDRGMTDIPRLRQGKKLSVCTASKAFVLILRCAQGLWVHNFGPSVSLVFVRLRTFRLQNTATWRGMQLNSWI